LRAKLTGQRDGSAPDLSEVDAVLDELAARGYLSDARFAQQFATQKSGDYSKRAIGASLKARGVEGEAAADALAGVEIDDQDALVALWRPALPQPAHERQGEGAAGPLSPEPRVLAVGDPQAAARPTDRRASGQASRAVLTAASQTRVKSVVLQRRAPLSTGAAPIDTAMKVADIRSRFLEFFAERGHTIVPSSSLVPGNDPTLLFVNSGMVQFKDVFVGLDKRAYNRATTAQRCVRAGGKHNDLDNVGYTARHHTFFEMLGNFSFGDYFKRDAIRYAWDLLTRVYGLSPDKLWTTVYIDDDEAFDIWTKEIGVPAERCIRIGDNKGAKYASDNFWQMADTGPCGPCSEIFYDHGPEVWGGPPGSPDAEGDRYIEIWNLVFMQFNRDDKGVLHPLPKPSVDTGMGLERLAAVLQHVHSNYEIDLFRDLIHAAARETGAKDLTAPSLRVIADHIRSCAFLIVDGVIPGSEGRGYVLRRIIRRAIRHGYQLGQKQPFFHRLVADLDRLMGDAYAELHREAARVAQVLKQEEERFGETIENGMKMLEQALAGGSKVLDGATAFTLYDTFGFPFDLTADVCRERGVTVDEAGFDAAMGAQRERARAASQFKAGVEARVLAACNTAFRGYDTLSTEGRVTALYKEGTAVETLAAGERGIRRAVGDSVLRGVRRPGRRSRRAVERRRVPHAVRGRGHAKDPAGGLRSLRLSRQRRAQGSATRSPPTSTRRPARARCAITRRRTSCTRRCATCSARMSSRRARSSTRTRRGSTSRTTPRSPTTRSAGSKRLLTPRS
jgi:hypothetical protein